MVYIPDDNEIMTFKNDKVIVVVISKDKLQTPKEIRDNAVDLLWTINFVD